MLLSKHPKESDLIFVKSWISIAETLQRYLLAACLLWCLLALIMLSHASANASRHCATVFLILFIFTMPFPLQAAKKL